MIFKASKSDLDALVCLGQLLWPLHTRQELAEEFSEIMNNGRSAFFLLAEDEVLIGFAQCQLRSDYVEGTKTSPVGYLEGIFIKPEYRGRGLSLLLLKSCEKWALTQGCSEFASDCELENKESLAFHLGAGFTEAGRIICFTKKIRTESYDKKI